MIDSTTMQQIMLYTSSQLRFALPPLQDSSTHMYKRLTFGCTIHNAQNNIIIIEDLGDNNYVCIYVAN